MRRTLLTDCVARSRSLASTLDSSENAPPPPDRDLDDLLADWRDVFDSDAAFRERLELADLTAESARERIRTGETAPADSVPPTFETAERIVDRAVELRAVEERSTEDGTPTGSLAERHADSPFVHLLAPLAEAIGGPVSLGPDHARPAFESLEDWLFERLTEVFRHPLFILFKAYQRREYPDREFEDATDSTAVYEEFVAAHRDYEPVFEQYPLLLKLLGVVAEQWRGTVRRLGERVAADRDDLARTFADGADLERIRDVATLSDDPHGEGEVVLRLDFECDCSVVYKPRSVAGEVAFEAVVDWANAHTGIPDLYAPAVLDEGAYGWMEYVPHRACDSAEALDRYYERMGGLTALAFVLGSTDLHHDNLVATGEHPVVVDHETALSPQVGASNKPVSPAMDSLVGESVLNTMLVPFSKRSDGSGDDRTSNGLSELAGEERREKLPDFRRPNTDAMDIGFDRPYRLDGENLPRFDGEVRDPSERLAELKRGFRAVAEAVLDDRESLLAPSGPLAAFEGAEVRYLPRPTSHYASKLSESLYSSQLRSGTRQSLALESLYTVFVPRADDDGDLWRLVSAEKASLRRLTIPRFTVDADGRELKDGRGNRLGVFVDESPLDHARRRISALDDHRVETQLRLLDLAFTGSTISEPVSPPPDAQSNSIANADSPSDVVSNVVGLIDEATTRYPDGSLRWAELARSSPTGRFRVREPTLDLYKGHVGVGLFLAGVAAVRDDPELADRSRRVLKPVRSDAEGEDADELGLGGMDGRGSVVYGLLAAGELLGDADLVARARTVAERTTREAVAADAELDVMAGSAGELLAQLAVHERTGDAAALERARWCGDRLLDAATEPESGCRVPASEDGDLRFGFAHGVGGIGYALVKLASVTGDETYAEVGTDALGLDTELWRRDGNAGERDGETSTVWGWCNGVAGVGTGRVAVADSATGERVDGLSGVREDLRPEPSREDSLCCGSVGRASFLLDAGEVFDDPSLVDRGEELFRRTLDRAEREGRLRLSNHLPMLPRLGLFTGIAGVGYVALRLEARGTEVELPHVTRLE